MTVASPARILGRLADDTRLRALAAVSLGAGSVAEVAARSGLSEEQAARALAQLLTAGVLAEGEGGLAIEHGAFADAARAASAPRARPDLSDATPEQEAVLRNFVDEEGRIVRLPARAGKRSLVLEYVATRFAPGREYAEREVNEILASVHADYVTLRRLLVDERHLDRAAGVYRRPADAAYTGTAGR